MSENPYQAPPQVTDTRPRKPRHYLTRILSVACITFGLLFSLPGAISLAIDLLSGGVTPGPPLRDRISGVLVGIVLIAAGVFMRRTMIGTVRPASAAVVPSEARQLAQRFRKSSALGVMVLALVFLETFVSSFIPIFGIGFEYDDLSIWSLIFSALGLLIGGTLFVVGLVGWIVCTLIAWLRRPAK